MAQPHHDQLNKLIAPLLGEFSPQVDIECTHFFNGAAVYVNGEICMSLTPNGLALKLADAERKEVLSLGGENLRMFPSGPIKKGYVILPQEIVNSADKAGYWLKQCIEQASSNPA